MKAKALNFVALREEPQKIIIRLYEKDGPIKKELKNALLRIKKNNPKARGVCVNWAFVEAIKRFIEEHS